MSKMHDVFMKTAFLFAEKSKCVSHHVGAVIVKDERIISVGYNGSPPGLPNCCEVFDKDNFDRAEHSPWSRDNEIHAEMNALMYATKTNIETEGADIYITISPCNDCLKNLTASGIKNVYYLYPYDGAQPNPALLEKVNVVQVPGAFEIKQWVEMNDLLYVPKQRQETTLHEPLKVDWAKHVGDILMSYYTIGWNDECNNRRTKGIPSDHLIQAAYQLGIDDYYFGDDVPSIDLRTKDKILEIITK